MNVFRDPRFWVCCAIAAIVCLILSPGLAAPRFPLGIRRIVASYAAGFAFVFIVATWVAAKHLRLRYAVPLGAAALVVAALTAAGAWAA